jgi:uncharacterized SAM-binding protein YcdF (DUF218 family)
VAVGAVLLAAWNARTAPLRVLGNALVSEDALLHAGDVAVVSMAGPQAAALDAAKLYRRGLVREIWIPRWHDEPVDRRVDALGIHVPRQHQVAQAILEQAGVPRLAIVQLEDPVSGLESEMAAVGGILRVRPDIRPIVVTQRSHTARARLLLRDVYAPASATQVHAPHADRFAPDAWWKHRGSVREVLLESLKWIQLLVRGPQMGRGD